MERLAKEWPCNCRCSHTPGHDELNYCRTHAAAPDMLEALKNLVFAAENSDTLKNNAVIRALVEQAQAAIAKAEPKS